MTDLVRVHLRTSADLADRALRRPPSAVGPDTPQARVEHAVTDALGYRAADVVFVAEDPTDVGSFSMLATRAPPRPDPSLVEVLSVEPVEGPPPLARASAPSLDAGLLVDEARAVALVLLKDTDPERLRGIGSVFAPDLPVVGALLLTRSRLEHVRRAGGQEHHDELARYRERTSLRMRAKPSHGRSGVGTRTGGEPLASGDAVSRIVAELRRSTLDLGPAAASSWDGYAGAVALLLDEDPPPEDVRDRRYDAMIVRSPATVERTLAAALADPHVARMSPSQIADELGGDGSTIASTLSALRPLGGGVVLADPARANALFALRPPPSAAAIKLGGSTIRPRANGLADPAAIPRTFRALADAGPLDDAAAQVERGKRAVARRNWVEWYRAAERGGLLGDVR